MIANRLSARSDQEVELVESGPDYFGQTLPFDLADGTRNSFKHDWGFKHKVNTQQKYRFPLPRGRVMGGSSAVNTCIALRPQPYDIDEWEAHGAKGWTWEAALPYLNKLETDHDFGDRDDHGGDGPMPLRRHPKSEQTEWSAGFIDACQSLGHPYCEDGNTAGTKGTGPHAMNKIEGRRISAAEAYLTPDVRERENLSILSETTALRFELDGERVTGVTVRDGSGTKTLVADRYICCLGAIQTPRLLLASGIGPKDQVGRLSVELAVPNDFVNKHLLDHPGFAIFYRLHRATEAQRTDPLIQVMCRFGSGRFDNDLVMQPGNRWQFPNVNFRNASMMAMIGKPHGTGSIVYTSADPNVAPQVNSALLDHPLDFKLAVDMYQTLFEVTQQPAMKVLGSPFMPWTKVLKDKNRIAKKVKKYTDSGYHPCGTVPMGEEGQAACAPDGRVYGLDNLQVIDASLFPTIPHANIHLTVLMVAERLADTL